MRTLIQEIRYSIRTLRRAPVFTTVAILSLALGIGANTAIFTLLDQILLRLLPIHNPQELVMLDAPGANQGSLRGENSFSYPMYTDLKNSDRVFNGMLARYVTSGSLSAGGRSERVQCELVSGNYFEVLGVRASMGRTFTPDDDRTPGGHPVVMFNHGFWMRRFGGDRSILNKSVLVNGHPMTVIGVTAPGFFGIEVGSATDIMVPIMMKAQMTPNWGGMNDRRTLWLNIFARLKPGVSKEQAEAATNVTFRQVLNLEVKDIKSSERFRTRFVNKHLSLLPGQQGRSELRKQFSKPLVVLMCMVGMVLLIACANVANLMVARAAGRQKEVAIRLAIGAGRLQIIRQFMVESTLLALAGGAAGLLLASWTGAALLKLLPAEDYSGALITDPDLRVLGFTLALSLLTGLLFGLAPALQSTRPNLAPTLKDEPGRSSTGGGHVGLRKGLVIAQVALSLLLLIGGGLFAKSLHNLKSLDPGFRTDHLMTFSVNPIFNGYTQPQMLAFFQNLQQKIRSIPGVHSVSMSEIGTLSGDRNRSNVRVPGYQPKEEEDVSPDTNHLSAGHFSTLGTPLIAGRDFNEKDGLEAPKVAIVNESMAHYFFGSNSPVGRKFGFGGKPDAPFDIEIVGVVKDGKSINFRDNATRFVYLPYQQNPKLDQMTFYVQTAQTPESLANSLQQAVRSLDANMPVFHVKSMQAQVDESLFVERVIALLSASFGFLATLLAAVGLYGVMAYTVARRTREIGIRMALGAERRNVLWLVMREVTLMAMIGIAVGLPAAYSLGSLIQPQLFGLRESDPATVAIAATAALAMVAMVSGYLPASRATRVDPMVALRYE